MVGIEAARAIIAGALKAGRAEGMKPLSVVVLDTGGHVVAFERADGASAGRFEIARAKAYGAVMLGMGGRSQMARAEAQGYFMAALSGVFDGRILPVPGGVLVRDASGALMGAVGVTGDSSDNDAAAALAGISAAGLEGEA
ncbi:MAG: heme-binding protein [Paracoccaceae bacterium]